MRWRKPHVWTSRSNKKRLNREEDKTVYTWRKEMEKRDHARQRRLSIFARLNLWEKIVFIKVKVTQSERTNFNKFNSTTQAAAGGGRVRSVKRN